VHVAQAAERPADFVLEEPGNPNLNPGKLQRTATLAGPSPPMPVNTAFDMDGIQLFDYCQRNDLLRNPEISEAFGLKIPAEQYRSRLASATSPRACTALVRSSV
jgi:hypothetical protein